MLANYLDDKGRRRAYEASGDPRAKGFAFLDSKGRRRLLSATNGSDYGDITYAYLDSKCRRRWLASQCTLVRCGQFIIPCGLRVELPGSATFFPIIGNFGARTGQLAAHILTMPNTDRCPTLDARRDFNMPLFEAAVSCGPVEIEFQWRIVRVAPRLGPDFVFVVQGHIQGQSFLINRSTDVFWLAGPGEWDHQVPCSLGGFPGFVAWGWQGDDPGGFPHTIMRDQRGFFNLAALFPMTLPGNQAEAGTGGSVRVVLGTSRPTLYDDPSSVIARTPVYIESSCDCVLIGVDESYVRL